MQANNVFSTALDVACKESNANKDAVDTINLFSEEYIKSILTDDIIKEMLKTSCAGKTKVGPEVIPLIKQLTNYMIMECGVRAAKQAANEGCTEIKVEHIEQCIHQIMLDLP